ncbi:MAG: 50S ribosomal protein L3 N(5)-glutamine methyltransferase [Coxiellaceae bacterium]|jgi:ribosomal protein L3 glutamine methyltransferase|nr:50S ribosomal protein L3 N(5)-glutamine methyltransferase [Coxiellaceae bacterium]
MLTSLNTIGDFINFAFTEFKRKKICFGHGTTNAWDEAIYLVLSLLHLSCNSNAKTFNKRLKVDEKQIVFAGIKSRIEKRIPTAYLVKEAWFLGRSFYVDNRVLIPRSPVAELIARRFAPWIKTEKILRILDIGTGSGCIAISLAYTFPNAIVDAIDISFDALEVAAINCVRHKMTNRVRFLQSDLFEKLQGEKYNIIISNPPYVSRKEMRKLPQEYVYEPEIALFGGKDGCDLIIKIIENASKYLASEGILVVEVGNSANNVIKKYKYLPFIWLEFERGDSEVFLLIKEQIQL